MADEEPQDEKQNTRGIPPAEFIESVEQYVEKQKKDIDTCLNDLHVIYMKYKFLESQLVSQKRSLLGKIPEIENALRALEYLKKKQEAGEEILTEFQMAEHIYAKASLKSDSNVFLWLGANVMLEYSFDEAEELLNKNLKTARQNLENLNKDIDFLKDQITITEVNVARVHNHRIMLKKQINAATSTATAAASVASL